MSRPHRAKQHRAKQHRATRPQSSNGALSLAIALIFSTVAYAQEDQMVVRVETEPEGSALVGQRIELQVDVLAVDRWANLPSLPSVEVSGAIVYIPPSQSVRLTEQIKGASYTGQRYEFWVYPQRQGALQIPALNLDVQLKAFGADSQAQTESAKTDAILVDVKYPEGVSASSGVICVTGFSATQSWQPSSGEFKVGDGITRTITRSVDDAPGMLLVPLTQPDMDGIGLYPKQPEVNDAINRGTLVGTRIETLTYIFESEGEFEIPSVRCQWWDLESKKLQTKTLEGLKIQVAPASQTSAGSDVVATSTKERYGVRMLVALGACALLGCVIMRFRVQLLSQLNRLRDRYDRSEQAHFRRFVAAAKIGDQDATLRTLVQWWDVADSEDQAPRLDQLSERFGDQELQRQLINLEAAVDSRADSWDQAALVRQVRQAREAWQVSRRQKQASSDHALPPLYR